jgi:hypothetical protein
MMIPHHQGAIDMAMSELRHGHDERLRRLAQQIIVDQRREIETMRLALGEPASLRRVLHRGTRRRRAWPRARPAPTPRARWDSVGEPGAVWRPPHCSCGWVFTGWSRSYSQDPPLALALVSDVSYALAATASLYFMLSLCMRFGAARVSWLDGLSRDAMTIYVLHYAPLVWLQFALMNVDMPSFAKVAIVFAGTLACCLAMTKAWSSLALGARPARRPSVELSCCVKGWKIRRPS